MRVTAQGTSMERHKSQQLSQIYRADDTEFQSASAPPRESAGLGLHARYGMGALMISIEVPWVTLGHRRSFISCLPG